MQQVNVISINVLSTCVTTRSLTCGLRTARDTKPYARFVISPMVPLPFQHYIVYFSSQKHDTSPVL